MYSLCVPRSKSVQMDVYQSKCVVVQGLTKQKDVCVLLCTYIAGCIMCKGHSCQDSFHSGKREGQPLAFLSGAFFSGDGKSYKTWWIKQLDRCSQNSLMSVGEEGSWG